MKGIAVPVHSYNQIAPVFLILSSAISILLLFSPGTDVWAEVPEVEKIAFVSKRDGNAEIYIMNPDGSEQVNLTQHPAEDYDPVWSPNGKQILFSSNRWDGIVFDLYLMDADGTNIRKVFKSSKYRREPTWSPNGKNIAYAQGEPRKAKSIEAQGLRFVPPADLAIYIATPNGDSAEKLTDGFDPSWSPDGSEIAFVAGGIEYTRLGIFNLQTRKKKTLISKEKPWLIWPTWWILSPRWSPRGDKIAFTKLDGGQFNEQGLLLFRKGTIYMANRDGTGLHQIINALSAYDPTWSPKGNHEFIFNARVKKLEESSYQLFKTNENGGNPTQITHEGSNSSPDWFTPNASATSP